LDPIIYVKAIIMGLVEGATEFIPVSSTGHLILAGDWLNFDDQRADTFLVFIQLGAILAVVWLYRAKVFGVLGDAFRRDEAESRPIETAVLDETAPRRVHESKRRVARRMVANLMVAFLPAALIGFLVHDWIKEVLFHPLVVAVALVVGGIAILLIERWNPREQVEHVDDLPMRKALGVGLAQVLSLIPGVSRSGATIMGGISLGLSRVAATEFSFFLAIPVMFAATSYDLFQNREILSASDIPLFAVGFFVSMISAVFIVKAFLSYVSKNSFAVFAWYRIAFGLFLMAFYWITGWAQ
jgi:undecaprenyl-diphosphatase